MAKAFALLRPESHVLFMSGYPEESSAQQNLIEIAAPFIQKPFSPAKLSGAIREVLDRSVSKKPA